MASSDTAWELEEGIPQVQDPFIQQYLRGRDSLILQEQKQRHDFNFRKALPPTAARACKIISQIRDRELHHVRSPGSNEQDALPSTPTARHAGLLSLDKEKIESTDLWEVMRKFPKGSLLHAPLHAAVNVDYLIDLAFSTPGIHVYADRHLAAPGDSTDASFAFQYSLGTTKDTGDQPTMWSATYKPSSLVLLQSAASSFPNGGEEGFRVWLKGRCTPKPGYSDYHRRTMPIVNSLLSYEPILRSCLKQVFTDLANDGIGYVELRNTFNFPYRKESKEVPEEDYGAWCHVFQEELAQFRETDVGQGFRGARIIWSSRRSLSNRDLVEDMTQCILAKCDYPEVICGFDIVGEGDERPLTDLVPILFWFRKQSVEEGVEIPFLFHAGESLRNEDEADQGLFDAILLGSRRICQGLSLHKHPLLMDLIKEKKILVECSPLSDEIFGFTDSIQTHPLSVLLSRGVSVSLGADAPGLPGHSTGALTWQFWQAIQGLDSMGLAGLAMMVENSIRWSCYEDQPTGEWLCDLREGILGEGMRAKQLQEWYAEFEKFCEWVTQRFPEVEVDEAV
ncbi:putative CECR1 family adenosine deaminase [Aspergillus heteromorphus CBS 117.55]|uniref:adenosine deaminase n=1 Tax=Aspergillus heteromorphus CBS 117.55 TaxID=1448321 RepID=A0A317WTW4_9EURO|nr:putative CECR1 family adenosine deaminase [Aspergillus heteromorphus CBS 117.55]PWY88378.1 putative CECR1 family adenosine deaminase [Aspergillus heteromorphus CBS 117.55]